MKLNIVKMSNEYMHLFAVDSLQPYLQVVP